MLVENTLLRVHFLLNQSSRRIFSKIYDRVTQNNNIDRIKILRIVANRTLFFE